MDISAGIVLFNPDINRLKENISAVIVQCSHVYLVDNGSKNIDTVFELLKRFNQSRITVISNTENLGIAKALNQLTVAAQEDGFRWILTLDQDSVSPPNIVEEFVKYANNQNVGMLCPVIYDRNKGVVVEAKDGYKEIDECITSGSLLNISAWENIGGFDETMFIDGVDFDICYRLNNPMQPGDVPVTYADTSALERNFGFKPSTSLRDGLRKFAEWYKEFYLK